MYAQLLSIQGPLVSDMFALSVEYSVSSVPSFMLQSLSSSLRLHLKHTPCDSQGVLGGPLESDP